MSIPDPGRWMSASDYFARIRDGVNFRLMQTRLVVVVGVGMVGSQIAAELAKCGVGRLRFIDYDILERSNLARHALDEDYIGWNKATAMATYLAAHVEGIRTEAMPYRIDRVTSNELLDNWLAKADLIVATTDQHDAQRRVGQRALISGIPAIFPALFVEGGGEIVVQFDGQLPCFSCWDTFRPPDQPLRGPTVLNHTALPLIFTSLRLSLGLLDQRSEDRELMRAGHGSPPYQVFGLNRFGTLESGFGRRRPNCPACGGGPGLSEQIGPAPSRQTAPVAPTTQVAVRPDLAYDGSRLGWLESRLFPGEYPSVLGGVLLLIAAIVFAASPVVIEFRVVPHIGILALIVGPACFVWVFAGLAAVSMAAWALLAAIGEAVSRI